NFKQAGEHKCAEKNAEDGNGLHRTVRMSQTFGADQLLDIAVFGGTVDRTLDREQKGQRKSRSKPAGVITGGDHQGDSHTAPRGNTDDSVLGKTVREKSRRGKQEDKWQQYQGVHDRHQDDLHLAVIYFEYRILNNDLVAQIHKGIQENYQQVRDKPAEFNKLRHEQSLLKAIMELVCLISGVEISYRIRPGPGLQVDKCSAGWLCFTGRSTLRYRPARPA